MNLYKKLTLVPLLESDKVYVFLNHKNHFEAIKYASKSLFDMWPSILGIYFCNEELKITFTIRKGAFKAIYDLLEDFKEASEKINS